MSWGALPVVEWHVKEGGTGVHLTNTRRWKDHLWTRINEWVAPNFAQTPDIYQNPDHEKFFVRAGLQQMGGAGRRHQHHDHRLAALQRRPRRGRQERPFRNRTQQSRFPGTNQRAVLRGRAENSGRLRSPRWGRGRSISMRSGISDTRTRAWRCCAGRCAKVSEQFRRVGISLYLRRRPRVHVPTQCCDVVVRVGEMSDNREIQGEIGRAIGRIAVEDRGIVLHRAAYRDREARSGVSRGASAGC